MRALSTLTPRQLGRVVAVHTDGATGERLLEMGLVPGTLVQVIRQGGRRGLLEVQLRGYLLSLRRSLAEQIDVASP